MDDYRDCDENYRLSLEKIIVEAGLKLPSIYGNLSAKDVKIWRKKAHERIIRGEQ